MFTRTTTLDKIRAMESRLKVVQGGTSAGKSIAILLILIDLALKEQNKTISIVSETLPHLRRGVIKDFLTIMTTQGYFTPTRWNKTNFTYEFETGTSIEFFSADQSGKVRGPRRNHLFVNECNRISLETYRQLALRTDGSIWLDYNPVAEFWVHKDVIAKEDHDFVIVTYEHNEALSPTIVKQIESYRHDENFWKVYGLGQIGSLEGQIFKNWKTIDLVPTGAELVRYGVDFGYTNDPSAIIAVYKHNDDFVLDEILYSKGMSNQKLAEALKAHPPCLVVADSAEPKSIDEIKMYGIQITGSTKGKGSVLQGIQLVQSRSLLVTQTSLNLLNELRNYVWKTDRDGNPLNTPEHAFSHAMDACRYSMTDLLGNQNMPGRVDFMI